MATNSNFVDTIARYCPDMPISEAFSFAADLLSCARVQVEPVLVADTSYEVPDTILDMWVRHYANEEGWEYATQKRITTIKALRSAFKMGDKYISLRDAKNSVDRVVPYTS
jgi:hypothetical protein